MGIKTKVYHCCKTTKLMPVLCRSYSCLYGWACQFGRKSMRQREKRESNQHWQPNFDIPRPNRRNTQEREKSNWSNSLFTYKRERGGSVTKRNIQYNKEWTKYQIYKSANRKHWWGDELLLILMWNVNISSNKKRKKEKEWLSWHMKCNYSNNK